MNSLRLKPHGKVRFDGPGRAGLEVTQWDGLPDGAR